MQVQVHYQGLDNSPWMDQFITKKVSKLERYLSSASSIQVHLKYVNRQYVTSLAIHNLHHDYAFTAEGQNLYESFTSATDKAARSLGEHKRMIKDKIHRKYSAFRQAVA